MTFIRTSFIKQGNKQATVTERGLSRQYVALPYFSRRRGESGIYLASNGPSITNAIKKKGKKKLLARLHNFVFAFLHFNVHDVNYHQAKVP